MARFLADLSVTDYTFVKLVRWLMLLLPLRLLLLLPLLLVLTVSSSNRATSRS